MDSLTWSRVRQAAEVFAALPDGVAASLLGRMQAPALALLSSALVAGDQDARQLRRVLRAFVMELSERSGAHLPDLGRRTLVQLCRFHPEQAAAILESWLQPPESDWSSLLARLAGVDWSPTQLDGRELGAALLMLAEPSAVVPLFQLLGPDEVHSFTKAMSTLPPMDSSFRELVLSLFEEGCGDWGQLVQEQPKAAAACLNQLIRSIAPWEKDLHFDWTEAPLSGPSIAAVLLDCLAPDWKEEFVSALAAGPAEHFRAATRLLLPAPVSLQEQLTKDFVRQFGEQALQPEVMRRCLERVAGDPSLRPLSRQAKNWQGLLILHGDLLENFLGDEASLAELSMHRSQLQAAWNRSFPDYLMVASPELGPFEVVVRLGEEVLERFELLPDRSLQEEVWLEAADLEPFVRSETYLQVLARKLWSVQARLARTFAVGGGEAGQLPADLVPAMAALRAFPADYLSQHLMELDSEGLWRVAESLPGLFALSPELLNERLLESCQLSPLELLQQAGLCPVDSSRCPARVAAVAVLLTLAPDAGSIARELVQKLGRKLGQQLTERMMRIFYRWQDRRLETAEVYPSLAAFLSWSNRGASCRRDAPSSELAEAIARVWPFWDETEALSLFTQQVSAHDLYRYIQEDPGLEPYVPGPVLASQFLHSLNDSEALRLELYWLDYPVPHLPIDLILLERAQSEWNRAAF